MFNKFLEKTFSLNEEDPFDRPPKKVLPKVDPSKVKKLNEGIDGNDKWNTEWSTKKSNNFLLIFFLGVIIFIGFALMMKP